jgi:putative two-component system response regulator
VTISLKISQKWDYYLFLLLPVLLLTIILAWKFYQFESREVGIPDNVLLKPGKLISKEFELIKTHTQLGVDILSGNDQYSLASQVCLHHHDRWDGEGYPTGLKGEEIPLIARIVSVIDVFDALISKRCYKKVWKIEKAIQEIELGSGSQFDPKVVDIFLSLHQQGRFNSIITLSND